jgi:murein L,D-transpeptidase YcbB/YkuD
MGKVKLYFRPLYFLHGTPVVSSIGSAASHGCVRMRNEDAIDLALLIHAADLPAVSAERLDSLQLDFTMTRMFALTQPVPLQITYQVAEVRADSLFLYADVYHLGPATVHSALVAMAATGVDTIAVRTDVVASAARDARRAAVAVSLDSLTMRRPKQ